jgi:hypothetical protein
MRPLLYGGTLARRNARMYRPVHAEDLATLLLVVAVTAGGCVSPQPADSSRAAQRDDPRVAILNIRHGDDAQAQILSLDGAPFDSPTARHAQVDHVRVPLRPGTHELRVVVPGPCTYFDGRPGPGPSLAHLRFLARAGVQYEVTLVSFPTQLFTHTQVHVYEVVRAPHQFRSVEQVISNEPAPSSCPDHRGMVQ